MAIRRRVISNPKPPAEYTPDIAARDALRIAEGRGLCIKPVDVVGLSSSIGLQIEYLPLADDVSGLLRKKDGRWLIGVNSRHHVNRQRFTIAHELGHYFLHRDHGDFVDRALFRKELQSDHREREANEFASKLLMPANEFRDLAAMFPGNAEFVAKQFGVSMLAAKFRAETLGEERFFG